MAFWSRLILGAVVLVVACAPAATRRPPDIRGDFAGATAAGEPVAMRFAPHGSAISAQGSIGEHAASGLAVLGWRGLLLVQQDAESLRMAELRANPDQSTVHVVSAGETIVLQRVTPGTAAPSSGPFAGRYRSSEPPETWIALTQTGNQLSGHGSVDDRPVALVATVVEERKARGTLLFPDQSRASFMAELSGDGRGLALDGLGPTVHLQRD